MGQESEDSKGRAFEDLMERGCGDSMAKAFGDLTERGCGDSMGAM